MKKGFTLIELLIVIAIIAILAAIAVPNFLEAQVRAKVARVRADQRSLATGLEAYYVDNNNYPDWASQTGTGGKIGGHEYWTVDADRGHANAFSGSGTGASSIHSFRVRSRDNTENLFFMLTTPISYISNFMPDPFGDTSGATYGYYSDKVGWILYSFGPDTDEAPNAKGFSGDIDSSVETLYNGRLAEPRAFLITGGRGDLAGDDVAYSAFTYDPTNGTASGGDVYRCKQ